jgi:hypothetical protein
MLNWEQCEKETATAFFFWKDGAGYYPSISEPGQRSRYSDLLWAGRPKGQSFQSRQGQDLSPFHIVQTASGAHLASYPMGTGSNPTEA